MMDLLFSQEGPLTPCRDLRAGTIFCPCISALSGEERDGLPSLKQIIQHNYHCLTKIISKPSELPTLTAFLDTNTNKNH